MINSLNIIKYIKIALFSLTLVTALLSPPVSAVIYTAYQGSSIIVKTVNGQITGSSSTGVTSLHPNGSLSLPLLGGVAIPSEQAGYACVLNNNVFDADNRRGVKVNNNGIMVGFTGTINNGVAHYILPGETDKKRITGGLSFNSFGVATPIGDVEPRYADRLCATVTLMPRTQVAGPANESWGNTFAEMDLTTWIYIPINIAPGTYPMKSLGIVQGASAGYNTNYSTFIPVINHGDSVEVLPPPCSINTTNNIIFDTTTEDGMKVSAPITYQCGQLNIPSSLQAFLQVRPMGTTTSRTELNMTINGTQPGGVVRGYAGAGLDTSKVNCLDNANSLSFNETFGLQLGTVTSNNNQEIPLYWQLCRKGNEVPGEATASALLLVNYK